MGYEIMYKKVFLKATDEMGVDLYTPVCLIGPNNVTQRHWAGNHYSERASLSGLDPDAQCIGA